jgi:hypothetical protein
MRTPSAAVLAFVTLNIFAVLLVPLEARPQARSERRVALLVGNGSYAAGPLRNAVKDVQAMKQILERLGFDVLLRENTTEKALKRAIDDFGSQLRDGGVGLFFYAGHGMQVDGRNYLIPIDVDIRTERDVDIEAVNLARVLSRMEQAGNRLNIVILDACRNNPFARSVRTSGRGLAAIDAPAGTLIAYATAPGSIAQDGDGENSVYTAALIKTIPTPGLKLEDVFKRVRVSVTTATRGDQVPWESSSLTGDFSFVAAVATVEPSQETTSARVRPPAVATEVAAVPTRREPQPYDIFLGTWTGSFFGPESVGSIALSFVEKDNAIGGTLNVYGYTGHFGSGEKTLRGLTVSGRQVSADLADMVKVVAPIEVEVSRDGTTLRGMIFFHGDRYRIDARRTR